MSNDKTLSTLTIFPISATKVENSIQQYRAVARNVNEQVVENISIVWLSSDTTIAKIDSFGKAICKKVGSVEITAKFDTIKSNTAVLNIIDPTIIAGTKEGIGVIYTDENPDFHVQQSERTIDINKDGDDDLKLGHTGYNFNNADLISYVSPIGENRITFNSAYKAIADSILLSNTDSTNSSIWPDYFNAWADTLGFGNPIDNKEEWTSRLCTFRYFFERDAFMWGWDFGLWQSNINDYLGIMIISTGDTTYGWVKIQVNRTNGLLVQEYAGIKLSEQ